MKNIFLLGTDKPSKLFIDVDNNKLTITDKLIGGEHFMNKNLFITSEKEVKDCWVLNTHLNEVYFCKGFYGIQPMIKKVILTTDENLVKDGVQAIDDEFLEWFVKNPSCEQVEVETYFKKIGVETDANGYREMDVIGKDYRITIPKENRSETMQRFIEGAKWQAKNMYSEEEILNILNSFSIDSKSPAEKDDILVWFKQFKKK